MNLIRTACSRLPGIFWSRSDCAASVGGLRSFSSWILFSEQRTAASKMTCGGISPLPSWQYQQVRTGKRGTEYQPKVIKRKRTHGWIKRLSTEGGIRVVLHRMLKGRKSLSH